MICADLSKESLIQCVRNPLCLLVLEITLSKDKRITSSFQSLHQLHQCFHNMNVCKHVHIEADTDAFGAAAFQPAKRIRKTALHVDSEHSNKGLP